MAAELPVARLGGRRARYQGAHWRRVSRYALTVALGLLFLQPDVLRSQSAGSRLSAIGITILVAALCDIWFSRRMGFTVDDRGLVLHYAFYRRRIDWEGIAGFEWRHSFSPRAEWIWILLEQDGRVRMPTVQRPPEGRRRSFFDAVFASENVRDSKGAEVDAMQTLQAAWAAAKSDGRAG